MCNFGPGLFFRWDISVICPMIVLKLTATVFTSLPFQAFVWSFQKHFGLWPKNSKKIPGFGRKHERYLASMQHKIRENWLPDLATWHFFTTITTQNMLIRCKSDFWTYATKLGIWASLKFNIPSSEWWRFTLKPQTLLLPHKRTKNDQA